MTRLSIVGDEPGVEIDLWGEDYLLVPATRSLSRRARPHYDKLEELEQLTTEPDDFDDQMVAAIGKLLDVVVRPAAGGKKASTLIAAKWKSDELSLSQLLRFLDRIGELNAPPR